MNEVLHQYWNQTCNLCENVLLFNFSLSCTVIVSCCDCPRQDKDSLRIIKARLLVLDEQHKNLDSENSQLQRRFATVQSERDMLLETFEQTLEWVRQRNMQSHQRIQQRLDDVHGRVEQKSVQLSEIMRVGQLDEVVLRNVTDKLDTVLSTKTQHNKQLQLDLARVQKVWFNFDQCVFCVI